MELAKLYEIVLLLLLITCAVSVNLTKSLLHSVIIFMSYSSIMCILWVLMESPDLAITEAAVGAGISGILFLVTLKKLRQMDVTNAQEEAAPVKTGRRVRNLLQTGMNAAQSSLDSMGGMGHGTGSGRGADLGGAVRSGMDAARASLDAMSGTGGTSGGTGGTSGGTGGGNGGNGGTDGKGGGGQ